MNATAEATRPMAKKKATGGTEPPTKAVKINRALAAKAEMIATDKGVNLSEYLSDAIRTQIDRDWAKMVKKVGGSGD